MFFYKIFYAHIGIYEVRILFDILQLIFIHFVIARVCWIGEFKGLSTCWYSRRFKLCETRCWGHELLLIFTDVFITKRGFKSSRIKVVVPLIEGKWTPVYLFIFIGWLFWELRWRYLFELGLILLPIHVLFDL